MVNVSYIVIVVILMMLVIIINGECVLYCDGGYTHDVGDHTQW